MKTLLLVVLMLAPFAPAALSDNLSEGLVYAYAAQAGQKYTDKQNERMRSQRAMEEERFENRQMYPQPLPGQQPTQSVFANLPDYTPQGSFNQGSSSSSSYQVTDYASNRS